MFLKGYGQKIFLKSAILDFQVEIYNKHPLMTSVMTDLQAVMHIPLAEESPEGGQVPILLGYLAGCLPYSFLP